MAPTQPCRYFQMGSCANGNLCSYAHEKAAVPNVCEFYLKGECRFGNYCQLSHVKPKRMTNNTKKTLVAPPNITPRSESWTKSKFERKSVCPIQNCNSEGCSIVHGIECRKCINPDLVDEHTRHCENSKSDAAKIECVVCFEVVLARPGGRFGLLNCNHCVCIDCIRSWRSTEKVDTSKTCPICRTMTHFVTPSVIWPKSDAEKYQLVTDYKNKLKYFGLM